MKLKVILTAVALIVLALVAIAFTIVKTIDFNQYRDYVAQRMKAATGRDLVIAGDVNVSFSFSPRLSARQISLRNAAWSDQPQMASLDEIEAEVDLVSLLAGEIRVRDVILRGGQVVVETNKDGIGNWVLDLAPATAPADSATTASGLPRVDQVAIEDVTLLYRDGVAGTRQTLKLTRFKAQAAPGIGLNVAVSGSWNDLPLEFSGTTGAPRQFTEGPLPVDLKGRLGAVALDLRGSIGEPADFSDLALDVTTSGPSLADLGGILGTDLPKSGPYSLSGRLTGGESSYVADRLSAKVGGSDAAGRIAVDAAGKTTRLTATLTSERLDFADLGLDDGDAEAPGDGRLFSAEPWPIEALAGVDGEITWLVGTLVRGGGTARNVTAALALKDGAATLNNLKAEIAGGAIAASGTLKPAKAGAALALKLKADGIESAPLLTMMGLQDVLIVDRVDLALDVNGPGTSLRELMAGLNGTASFATGSGEVRNSFARLLLANLFGLLTPGGGDGARISCIAGRFDIKKGIATTRGTVVDTPGAIVVGAGNIDLRNERIDLRIDPKSRNLNLSAIAVPVRVTGPLADPNVVPDPVATVGNTVEFATGTVNVATLGIFGALTGLGENSDPGTNSCAGALGAALSGKTLSPGEKVLKGVGEAAEGVGEGAADVLKGVGEGLNDLFGN
jgi:hypothetical protein